MSSLRHIQIVLGCSILASLSFNFFYASTHRFSWDAEVANPRGKRRKRTPLPQLQRSCQKYTNTLSCVTPCQWCEFDAPTIPPESGPKKAFNCIPRDQPCRGKHHSQANDQYQHGVARNMTDTSSHGTALARHTGAHPHKIIHQKMIKPADQSQNRSAPEGRKGWSMSKQRPSTNDARDNKIRNAMRLARRQSRQRQAAHLAEYEQLGHQQRESLVVLPEDAFFKMRYASPVVLKAYKLVFVPIPKVACTQWLQLFRRIEGHNDWDSRMLGLPYTPSFNGLTYLSDFSLVEANEIMKSPEWTKAVFVRDPKERFLSAYLDKVVKSQNIVHGSCCPSTRDCVSSNTTFAQFFNLTEHCYNEHWAPQSDRLSNRMWEQMNFVGHMNRLEQDARLLLERIGVWDRYGSSGWGPTGRQSLFAPPTDPSAAQRFATQAQARFRQYYTPDLEQLVEHRFQKDYQNKLFQLPLVRVLDDRGDAV